MRILTITSHISSNALPCFQRNKTGFGYMVHDIITALTQKVEVDVFVYYYRFKELHLDGARYIGCSLWNIIMHLFQCISPMAVIRLLYTYPVPIGSVARVFYCWLLTGYYRDVIQKGNYDIVHIHGCSVGNDLWIQLCKQLKQQYLVTLHGLNSFSDSIYISKADSHYEKDFLHDATIGKHHVTVIASGIKKKIMAYENVECADTISVVCNAFHFNTTSSSSLNVREKHNIPTDAQIVLYVGNISYNKNQRQMVRAFELMNKNICKHTYVLFIGRYAKGNDDLYPYIEKSPYKEHLICCGGIDKSLMPAYFKAASAVVLLSISEGFGLSLVEGMHFGVPCMTFTDLDAYIDIYDPSAMLGIPTRSDKAVAEGLEELLTKKWDNEDIKSYSSKFNCGFMAAQYLSVFYQIINQ